MQLNYLPTPIDDLIKFSGSLLEGPVTFKINEAVSTISKNGDPMWKFSAKAHDIKGNESTITHFHAFKKETDFMLYNLYKSLGLENKYLKNYFDELDLVNAIGFAVIKNEEYNGIFRSKFNYFITEDEYKEKIRNFEPTPKKDLQNHVVSDDNIPF